MTDTKKSLSQYAVGSFDRLTGMNCPTCGQFHDSARDVRVANSKGKERVHPGKDYCPTCLQIIDAKEGK